MKDKRKFNRTVCNRQVTFSINDCAHNGTIENISNDGTLILTDTPIQLPKDAEITIAISYADQGQGINKKAKIVWADERMFGAEFI